MRQLRLLFLLAGLGLATAACESEVVTVPDNRPPADTLVSRVTAEQYVNRATISLLGRKPETAERDAHVDALLATNLAQPQRQAFIQALQSTDDYRARLYDTYWVDLLRFLDTNDINRQIGLIDQRLNDPNLGADRARLEDSRAKLQALLTVYPGMMDGTMTLTTMHRLCTDNFFYDQINMGATNFVLALFEYFLQRTPTDAELAEAETMYTQQPGTLFLQQGASKEDLLDIFFGSTDYYAGLVDQLYTTNLYRKPTSTELEAHVTAYAANPDFRTLQRAILTTDEYVLGR